MLIPLGICRMGVADFSLKEAIDVDSQGVLEVGEGMSKDWSRIFSDVEVTLASVGLWTGARKTGFSTWLWRCLRKERRRPTIILADGLGGGTTSRSGWLGDSPC